MARSAEDPAVRDEALAAFATLRSPEAVARLVRLLPALTAGQRGNLLDRLAAHEAGASAIVGGLRDGSMASADLGVSVAEKLMLRMPGDPAVAALWRSHGGDAQRALRLPGGRGDFAETQLTLAGPFTVECWAKLDPGIDHRDGLLGLSGVIDFNFFDGRFRVWLGEANDVVQAKKKAVPGVWTHYAVTRDGRGFFHLYLNGELEMSSAGPSQSVFTGLNVGRSRLNPSNGTTAGWLAEYRVWNVARSASEVRDAFDRIFSGTAVSARPPGLVELFTGANWGPLKGAARVEPTEDAPVLLTPGEAAKQEEKFTRFRALANGAGNPDQGRQLFTLLCLTCHQQGGKGGLIAPPLDGIGNTGVEALLRNILTPSAAMESAYRTYRVVLKDGSVRDGFLADDTPEAVVLRTPGAEDQRIARGEIKQTSYLNRSLMPEGLLEAMPPQQVSDLFSYLKTLK